MIGKVTHKRATKSAAQLRKMRELKRTYSELAAGERQHISTTLFDPISCLPIYVHKAIVSLNHDREYEREHGIGLGVGADYNEIVPVIPTIVTKTKKQEKGRSFIGQILHRFYVYIGLEDADEDENEVHRRDGYSNSKHSIPVGVHKYTNSNSVHTSLDVTQECYFPLEWRFIHIFDYFASVYHYEFVSINVIENIFNM